MADNNKTTTRKKNGNAAPKQTASVDIVANSKLLKTFQEQYNHYHPEKTINVLQEHIVGRNGYYLGQQFHATGVVYPAPIKNDKGEQTGVYLALTTTEGVDISLAAVMGVTSLRGYTLEGTLKEYRAGVDEKDLNEFTAEVTDKVKTQAAKNNQFNGWDIPTRDLYKLAAMIEADANLIKGKTITFEGIALRPVRRRKTDTDFNNIEWKAGDLSIITQRLWSVSQDTPHKGV